MTGIEELIQLFGNGIIDKVKEMKGEKKPVPIISLTSKDFKWLFYSVTANRGDFKCCRCAHYDSGVAHYSAQKATKIENRKEAFRKVTDDPKFKAWLAAETLKKMKRLAQIEEALSKQIVKRDSINLED